LLETKNLIRDFQRLVAHVNAPPEVQTFRKILAQERRLIKRDNPKRNAPSPKDPILGSPAKYTRIDGSTEAAEMHRTEAMHPGRGPWFQQQRVVI
jgi:hypothetical protein